MTAKDLLFRMPELIDTDAVGETEAVVQYATEEPVYQVLEDGEVRVHEGVADEPDLTVEIGGDDLVALFRGELNGMAAFMSGRVKVSGDLELAQRLVGFVDQERMRELA